MSNIHKKKDKQKHSLKNVTNELVQMHMYDKRTRQLETIKVRV